MPYPQAVKEAAYRLDPECWVSYSGQPKNHKQHMDARRTRSLERAMQDYRPPATNVCPCCGRPMEADEE